MAKYTIPIIMILFTGCMESDEPYSGPGKSAQSPAVNSQLVFEHLTRGS